MKRFNKSDKILYFIFMSFLFIFSNCFIFISDKVNYKIITSIIITVIILLLIYIPLENDIKKLLLLRKIKNLKNQLKHNTFENFILLYGENKLEKKVLGKVQNYKRAYIRIKCKKDFYVIINGAVNDFNIKLNIYEDKILLKRTLNNRNYWYYKKIFSNSTNEDFAKDFENFELSKKYDFNINRFPDLDSFIAFITKTLKSHINEIIEKYKNTFSNENKKI